jgi:hypothetical protein
VGASYALSNGWEHEEERLGLLEAVLDPLTFARLSSLPVARGWRCLEVGAGRGSVTRWLCDRVVVEDFDTYGIDLIGPDAYRRAMETLFAELATRGGSDYRWSRHLGPRFAAHGLADIRVEGQILFTAGSSVMADLLELTLRQLLGDPDDGDGAGDRSDLGAAIAALSDPATWASLPVLIGAVGRAPR